MRLGNTTKPKTYGVGVHPIHSSDRGFESGCDNGCSVVFVACFVGSSLCDGLIPRSEESYGMCVCLIVSYLETLKRGYLSPIWAVVPQEKTIIIYIVQHST
jgi:hypothetical protein